jgi:hypothetical protein
VNDGPYPDVVLLVCCPDAAAADLRALPGWQVGWENDGGYWQTVSPEGIPGAIARLPGPDGHQGQPGGPCQGLLTGPNGDIA